MTETGLLPGMTETSTTRVELLGWGEDLLARAAEWLLGDDLVAWLRLI